MTQTTHPEHDEELESLVRWITDKAQAFADDKPVATFPVDEVRKRIAAHTAKAVENDRAEQLARSVKPKNKGNFLNDELREAILKKGTVRMAKITISQNFNSNNTVSPIKSDNQEIVEIGIDDLMRLISTHVVRALERVQDKILEVNGAYIGMDGQRVDNIVSHDYVSAVIKEELAHLNSQRKEDKQ